MEVSFTEISRAASIFTAYFKKFDVNSSAKFNLSVINPFSSYVLPTHSNNCLFSEINRATQKTQRKPAPHALENWIKNIDSNFDLTFKLLTRKGFTKVSFPESFSDEDIAQRKFLYTVAIRLTATTGTGGAWFSLFHLDKNKIQNTKTNIMMVMDSNPRFLDQFIDQVELTYAIFSKHPAEAYNYPVYVYNKDEAIPKKKFSEGKSRSVQMSDWSLGVLETAAGMFMDKNGLYCTWDTAISSANALRSSGTKYTIVGDHPALHIRYLDLVRPETSFVAQYDVTGWDRFMPTQIIDKVYSRMIFSSRTVADAISIIMGGRALFAIEGRLFRLPLGTGLWCSGSLKTLNGNCEAHESLITSAMQLACRQARVKYNRPLAVVAGDDGNVIIPDEKTGQLFKEALEEHGAELKYFRLGQDFDFCSLSTLDGRISMDLDRIKDKCVATDGFLSDEVSDALETQVRYLHTASSLTLAHLREFASRR